MRYVYTVFILLVITVVSIVGFRGGISRRPPVEIFADMTRQPKARPESASAVFYDGTASRPRPAGTVAQPQGEAEPAAGDSRVQTGRMVDSTNWVETIPVPVTLQFLERGSIRFQIFCAPCHGEGGDGRGITMRYNMVAMANFHDKRLIDMRDGEIFNTITHGKNLMGAYGASISVEDRWAIVGYIRALERSRLATVDDVPLEQKKMFTGGTNR